MNIDHTESKSINIDGFQVANVVARALHLFYSVALWGDAAYGGHGAIHRTHQAPRDRRDGASPIHQLSAEEPRRNALIFIAFRVIFPFSSPFLASNVVIQKVRMPGQKLIEGGEGV